jgi:hypothetical protein
MNLMDSLPIDIQVLLIAVPIMIVCLGIIILIVRTSIESKKDKIYRKYR